MIPVMIKKALIELGGLEEEILDIKRNGSEEGFVLNYDYKEFYLYLRKGHATLKMAEEDYRVVLAVEKFLSCRHYKRTIGKKEIVYEWNPKSYGDKYSEVF